MNRPTKSGVSALFAALALVACASVAPAQTPAFPKHRKWSPGTPSILSNGSVAHDSEMGFQGVRATGSFLYYLNSLHDTRGITGQSADDLAQVVFDDIIAVPFDPDPPTADVIRSTDGTLHVYYQEFRTTYDIPGPGGFHITRASELWYVSKTPTGSWTAPVKIGPVSWTVDGDITSMRYYIHHRWTVSLDPATDLPVCYYAQNSYVWDTSGIALGTGAVMTDSWTDIWKHTPGADSVNMVPHAYADVENMVSHRGDLLMSARTAAEGPRSIVYVDGTTFTTIKESSSVYQARFLYVDTGDLPHMTWTEFTPESTSKVMYSTGPDPAPVEDWSEALDGAVVVDGGGSVHRYRLTSTAEGNRTLARFTVPIAAEVVADEFIFQDLPPNPFIDNQSIGSAGVGPNGMLWVEVGGRMGYGRLYQTWQDNLGFQGSSAGVSAGSAVDLASGNVSLALPLFSTAGHGPTPGMGLIYNSLDRVEGVAGLGWRHNFLVYIERLKVAAVSEPFVLHLSDGRILVLDHDSAAGGWVPRDEYGVSLLAKEGPGTGETTVEFPDGSKWTFNTNGRLKELKDRDGNKITLEYDDNPVSPTTDSVLVEVSDDYGRTVTLTYDIANRLDQAVDPGFATYGFVYASEDRLTGVHFKGTGATILRQWTFGYFGEDGTPSEAPVGTGVIEGPPGFLCTYRTPGMFAAGATTDNVWLGYFTTGASMGRLKDIWDAQLLSSGVSARQHQEITWDLEEGVVPALIAAHLKDRRAKTWHYEVDSARSLLLKITDPVNGAAHPTELTYDLRRNVLTSKDTSGKTTEFTYITPGEGLLPWVKDLVKSVKLPGDTEVTTYEYHPTFNSVTKIIPVTGVAEATTLSYDAVGHVETILRPDDPAPTTLVYTGGGKLLQSIDPEGKKVTYTYEAGAYGLATQIQVDGVVGAGGVPKPYKMTYNAMGQTATSEQPFGGITTYAYTGAHEVHTVTPPADSGGGHYEYIRDGGGRVIKTVDPNSNGLEQEIDAFGRTTSTKNARGDIAYVFYDESHRVTDQTDFGGHVTHFEYDDLSRVVYTSRLVDAPADPDPAPDLYLITIMEYDEAGNLTKEIVKGSDDNPPPRITTHHYDSKNLRFKTVLPGGDTEILYGYDSKRQLIVQETWVDPGTGFEFFSGTFYFRDTQGRVVKQVEESEPFVLGSTPAGRQTVMGYNGRGLVATRTSHLGHTWTYEYDDAGRQVFQEDPTGVQTLTEYTEDGQVRGTDIVIPGHAGFQRPMTNVYDSRGQLTYSFDNINPADGTSSFYDDGGRLLFVEGAEGLYRSMTYDTLNRVTSEFTRKDTSTTLRMDYVFDAAGNMTKRFNSPGEALGGPAWTYAYNEGNRQSKATTPAILGVSHDAITRYDAVGNVLYQQDEDGNETFHVYDVKNRLTETTYLKPPVGGVPGTGALWEKITRTYDLVGNLLAIEGTVSKIRVDYSYKPDVGPDPHTHELYKTVWTLDSVPWHTIVYTYDEEGRRATTTLDPGPTGSHLQEFAYDDANRLASIKNDGVTQATFTYTDGFLTTTELGNGNKIHRTYDLKGRLEELEHAKDDGESLAKIQYGYDKRDRRTSVTYLHLAIQSTFTYTDNSWLASETHSFSIPGPDYENLEVTTDGGNESAPSSVVTATPHVPSSSGSDISIGYTYDERGNRTVKDVAGGAAGDATYVYDEEDRLVTEARGGGAVGIAYAYANRGDLVSKVVTPLGMPGESHSYITDYLARITAYSGPDSSWSYVYAPTGDRIAKQHVGLGFEDDNQWDLISDGDVLASYHKSGATEVFDSIYVTPGMDGRLARIDGTGTAAYFMNDALNSVHQVTSAAGALSGTDFNDAWGNPIDVGLGVPGGLDGRFSYTNRERDNESGLMFYRARSYDSMTGRFASRDSVAGLSLYAYAENNPANGNDPTGHYIVFPSGNPNLEGEFLKYANSLGITNDRLYSDSNKNPSRVYWQTYAEDPKPTSLRLETEIIWRMMLSRRVFGFNTLENLKSNVSRRIETVNIAKNLSQWGFGDAEGFPEEWTDPGRSIKPVTCLRESLESLLKRTINIGCLYGTRMIMLLGIARADSASFDAATKKESGKVVSLAKVAKKFIKNSPSNDPYDWVPGDWGYISNPTLYGKWGGSPESFEGASENPAYFIGENMIYIGGMNGLPNYATDSNEFIEHAYFAGPGLPRGGLSLKGLFQEVDSWNNKFEKYIGKNFKHATLTRQRAGPRPDFTR